jgi:methylglutaconyl-CoA hydratase
MVSYNCRERIGLVTLNRPEKRNALNPEMVRGIKNAFGQALSDRDCKVIVLQAEGEAFCAGADLQYIQSLQSNTFEENLEDSNNLKELFQLIYHSPKATISSVQGHALAGGCGLATVCDFSFSVPEAKFGYTEVRIGFIPAIVKVFLLRKIGEGKAKQLLLTGDIIQAQKALELGLINGLVPAEKLKQHVWEFAAKLCREASGQSVALTKEMIHAVQSMDIEAALDYAARKNAEARASDDCKKGIAAFLSKEKLSW